jgi:hypothetical protein
MIGKGLFLISDALLVLKPGCKEQLALANPILAFLILTGPEIRLITPALNKITPPRPVMNCPALIEGIVIYPPDLFGESINEQAIIKNAPKLVFIILFVLCLLPLSSRAEYA